jgi:hypothetical protein
MSPRARHHHELLTGASVPAADRPLSTKELLARLEGERVIPLPEVGRLNDLSVDTLKRHYSGLIVRVSTGRLGMRLKDALSIAQPLDAA